MVFVSCYPVALYGGSVGKEEPEQTTGAAARCLAGGRGPVRKFELAFNQWWGLPGVRLGLLGWLMLWATGLVRKPSKQEIRGHIPILLV